MNNTDREKGDTLSLVNSPKCRVCDLEYICDKYTVSRRGLYILHCYIRPSQPLQGYQLAVDVIDSLFDIEPQR